MIYTLTLNPAIDYILHLDKLQAGTVNRTSSESFYIGGKGINVSLVLKELDIQSTALGFVAGFTGKAILDGLTEKGIINDFITLPEGTSRINVKIKNDIETDINGKGPNIDEASQSLLFSKLDALKNEDILVLSGSVAKGLSDDFYAKIIECVSDKNVRVIVDATKNLLTNTLKFKPFLIKPNIDELSDLFNVTISDTEDVIKYAKKLQEMGAVNVLVSLGKDGAILLDGNGCIYKADVPSGKAVNSVGAGDSMVAGFIAGILKENNSKLALKLATACGSATAFSDDLAKKDKIDSVFSLTYDPQLILEE